MLLLTYTPSAPVIAHMVAVLTGQPIPLADCPVSVRHAGLFSSADSDE